MAHRLKKQGLKAEQQHPINVYDEDGTFLGEFFADLLVEEELVIELKAAQSSKLEIFANRKHWYLLLKYGGANGCHPGTTEGSMIMSHMTGDSENTVFHNTDERLRGQADVVLEARKAAGLEGMVGGLDHVIVNVEPDHQRAAVEEWMRNSGYGLSGAFENPESRTYVLQAPRSADILIRTRLRGANPFASVNRAPKTAHLPNVRVETFVFEITDLAAYVEIQRARAVRFLTDTILQTECYSFIQTAPSLYTGNSVGLIQWTGERGQYGTEGDCSLNEDMALPNATYRKDIGLLDHAATRVIAEHRDPAILEFMALTNYRFEFALYIAELNSITNVARLPGADFAMVFTSGIHPSGSAQAVGPTEQFVQNYGPRVHHLALCAQNIDDTYAGLQKDGLQFLSGLVGSREEGLKQAFSVPSPYTLAVTEYIQRYDGFDGFFTRSNVAHLTAATAGQ